MAEAQKLPVRPRHIRGKQVGRLRRSGVLPAVVFGGHAESVPVETDMRSFELGYRRWGNTTLLALEGLGGGEVSALIHSVSRDPRSGRLLHVDFQRVSLTEKTHADVPLHFMGDSPAVRTLGAVLVHAMDRVRVEAFPQDIPHQIDVDQSRLKQVDDAIHVRDLIVDASALRILDEAAELVVKVVPARVEEVAEPAAAEAAAETPEGEAVAEGAESERPEKA
ncbi:MAG: 50S ribosomal protein L25 [Chloroflexota bacterium]|nr:50S ribosomal protein L25 [Chloroflexota bacterium]